MRRRQFITLLSSAATMPFAALAVRAQQAEGVRRIGVLVLGSPDPEPFVKELRDALRKLGYADGRNIQLELRSAGGKASALPDAAAELVRRKVDVIVAWQTPSATAAKHATAEIPIVMTAGDPVETGLVASLSRPGGNVTGMDNFGAQLGGKCVELIRDTIPAARRVAILANAADPFTKSFLREIDKVAGSLGIATQPLMRRPGDEFETAFAEMRKNDADAVIIQPTLLSPAAVGLATNVDDLVAKELLDPNLLFFVRIQRVCKDLPDGDCDDGGTVAEDLSHGHVPASPANHSTAASSVREGRYRFATETGCAIAGIGDGARRESFGEQLAGRGAERFSLTKRPACGRQAGPRTGRDRSVAR